MLNFHPITLEDRARLEPWCQAAAGHGSEYAFPNLYFWGHQEVCYTDGGVPLILSHFAPHDSYLFPYSAPELLSLLRQDAAERGIKLRVFGLLPEDVTEVERRWPGQYRFHSVRDSADYVYTVDRLADLHGKHLQAKRNHCNRFEEAFPDYRVEPLTPELLPACRAFTEQWYEVHTENGNESDFVEEREAIARAFDSFEALQIEGAVLFTPDRLVAFSMGSRIRPTVFDTNFEKADAAVNGAYAIINRDFARMLRARYPELELLNREDDMGIEGLRRAKESYLPDELLEKQQLEVAE